MVAHDAEYGAWRETARRRRGTMRAQGVRRASPVAAYGARETMVYRPRLASHADRASLLLRLMLHAIALACVTSGLAAAQTPATPPLVQGQVTDEAGKPVPGAEVFLEAHGNARREALLAVDADGRFSLDPPKGYGFLAAVAPGRALAAAALPPGSRRVILRMGAPRQIAGKALTTEGKPAAGVAVRVMTVTQSGEVTGVPLPIGMSGRFPAYLPESVRDRLMVQTDAAGAYRLLGLPTGPLRLELRDPRFVTRYLDVADDPPETLLEPGCRIHGRITGYDPEIKGWQAWTMPSGPRGAEMTPVKPDGTFLLYGLPAGEYPVLILRAGEDTPEDLKAVPAVTVTLTPQKPDADASMHVVPMWLLVGRTVDAETKAPLSGVPIHYNGPHRPQNALTRMVVSGEDGTFRIRMPAGRARLALGRSVGGRSAKQSLEVDIREERETPVEFPVRDWLSLSGVVLDAAGGPAAGASVTAQWGDWHEGTSTAAGTDGRFRLAGLPNAEARVSARRGEDATAQAVVVKPPFAAGVRLEIGPLPQVTLVGRVVDDAGRPAAGVMVTLRQISRQDGQIRSERHADQAATDNEGRYRFVVHDLAGEYHVRPGSEDQRMLRGGEPVGDQGPERRFIDLVILSTRGSVAGRVTDANGQPLAGVAVFWASGSRSHYAATDAEGRFRIAGLPERPVALVARDPKGGAAFIQAVPGKEAVAVLKR